MVKDMSKFSLRRGIQRGCQGKLFSMIASQDMPFSQKKWCCVVDANLNTFLARIALIATPTPKISGMSLIEQGDILHWVNQISVQPEPSSVIHPNGGSPEPDVRQNLSCFCKINCLRFERVSLLQKKLLFKKPL